VWGRGEGGILLGSPPPRVRKPMGRARAVGSAVLGRTVPIAQLLTTRRPLERGGHRVRRAGGRGSKKTRSAEGEEGVWSHNHLSPSFSINSITHRPLLRVLDAHVVVDAELLRGLVDLWAEEGVIGSAGGRQGSE
jgi:hypothetical protein